MIDVYICDSNGNITSILENVRDIIVTERVQDHDDFQFTTSDIDALKLIRLGFLLRFSIRQDVIFEVETIKAGIESDGSRSYRFEGRALTSWLETQPALLSLEPTADYDASVNVNNRVIFERVLKAPSTDFPVSTVYKYLSLWGGSGSNIEYKIPRKDKWSVIQELCKTYNVDVRSSGFTDKGAVIYTIQPLRNRTGKRIDGFAHYTPPNDAFIRLSHITNDFVSEEVIQSKKNYVNVAMVFTENTRTIMHRGSTMPSKTEVQVKFQDSTNVAPDSLDVRSKIDYERAYARLQAETILNDNANESIVSVKLAKHVLDRYGDGTGNTYTIGDVIALDPELLPNSDTIPMLVSEYTHSSNDSGYSAYPTLSELASTSGYTVSVNE